MQCTNNVSFSVSFSGPRQRDCVTSWRLKGVYHNRPATIRAAMELLADPAFKDDLILTGDLPIEEVDEALRSMMRKQALKVVIKKQAGRA